MTWMQDRQNRRYAVFLAGICLALAAVFFIACVDREIRIRDSLLKWERAAASSLLEQGVPEGTVALAFKNTETTRAGEELLRKIGYTEENRAVLSVIREREEGGAGIFIGAAGLGVCLLLWAGTLCYLRRREKTYEHAAHIIDQYAEGDFSERISRGERGMLDHLFSAVDRLSTALQAKGEEEKKSREFLKDTISDISHQLKTPLAALHMYTEIIAGEPEEPETVRVFAEKSEESLGRMDRLIRMLLRVTRLDAGSVRFRKQKMYAADLVREACADLMERAERERKKISFYGEPDAEIRCDREWTAEAVGNLVKNALDHTRSGGQVAVSWKKSPAMFRIIVADDGTGISQEDIHHIFKRFYRSRQSSDTQGVGLGLPLARSIIEGQGGRISVESSPGQGAVFTASFPDTPEEITASERPQDARDEEDARDKADARDKPDIRGGKDMWDKSDAGER